MKVTPELVQKLAALARLQFEDEEKEAIRADLERMIGFVDKLNELDTTGVEPLIHMAGEGGLRREDLPGGMLTQEEALRNAGQTQDGFFTVPAAVKRSEP